jgi:hypothetical protein
MKSDEKQTPAPWNTIGRSMAAPPPVLSPSHLTFVSLPFYFREEKCHVLFKNYIINMFDLLKIP